MKHPKAFQVVTSLAILALATFVLGIFYFTKPEPPKSPPQEATALVEVVKAKWSDERTIITAYGTVVHNRRISIHPEVGGIVVEVNDDLTPGGLFNQGDILLKIDPRDYITIVEQEKANYSKAQLDLKEEEGKQVVAKREWGLLKDTVPKSDLAEHLALRKPHIEEKQAALLAAKARLEKAELDLERTVLKAPFDSVVIDENVDVGQVINQGTTVADLVATDMFRVQVSVPYDRLDWIHFPRNGEDKGSPATIIVETGDGKQFKHSGEVIRYLADVDPNSRMARVIIGARDPLCLASGESCSHSLLIDTYVRVDIEGPVMKGVIKIPRRAIRDGNKVWVMDKENRLKVKQVEISLPRQDDVLISSGLKPGDQVVISSLPLAVEGMKLQRIESDKNN